MIKGPFLMTTIITIISTVIFTLFQYYRLNRLSASVIILFAIIFWILLFSGLKYSARATRKMGKKPYPAGILGYLSTIE
jgi:hypothetical protein